MILITFRGNGLPTVVIFLIFLLLLNFRQQSKKILASGVLLSIFVILVSSSFMPNSKSKDFELATGWIIYDISCYASTYEGRGFVEREFPGIGTTAKWSSSSACTWFSDTKLTTADIAQAKSRLIPALFKLIQEDPKFLLETHMKRHEYVVPLPIFGLVQPPFIHSTIEYPDLGVSWAFKNLAEKIRIVIRLWNFGSFFFAYSGFWLLLTACYWIFTRQNPILHILTVSLVINVSLFIFAGISDARYALFTLIGGQGLALSFILNHLRVFREGLDAKS
jgi:hypothetical protein